MQVSLFRRFESLESLREWHRAWMAHDEDGLWAGFETDFDNEFNFEAADPDDCLECCDYCAGRQLRWNLPLQEMEVEFEKEGSILVMLESLWSGDASEECESDQSELVAKADDKIFKEPFYFLKLPPVSVGPSAATAFARNESDDLIS